MKVLVVDDEALIRMAVVATLEDVGIVSVEASSGAQALSILADDPAITFLFTDILMLGMTGLKLAEHALRLRPDLSVAYTTGFTELTIPHAFPVIMKPWETDDLLKVFVPNGSPAPGR